MARRLVNFRLQLLPSAIYGHTAWGGLTEEDIQLAKDCLHTVKVLTLMDSDMHGITSVPTQLQDAFKYYTSPDIDIEAFNRTESEFDEMYSTVSENFLQQRLPMHGTEDQSMAQIQAALKYYTSSDINAAAFHPAGAQPGIKHSPVPATYALRKDTPLLRQTRQEPEIERWIYRARARTAGEQGFESDDSGSQEDENAYQDYPVDWASLLQSATSEERLSAILENMQVTEPSSEMKYEVGESLRSHGKRSRL